MPEQVIGSCSICGGDVVGWIGPWMATIPPPVPKCAQCGAISAAHKPVIPMRKANRVLSACPEGDTVVHPYVELKL